jgi:hypothetical protein
MEVSYRSDIELGCRIRCDEFEIEKSAGASQIVPKIPLKIEEFEEIF